MTHTRSVRILGFLLSLTLCLPILHGCAPKQKAFTESWFDLFDTFSTLTAHADDEKTFDTYADLVHDTLTDYHRLLDIYHTYDGIQNLKTLNDAAGEWVAIDPRLADFLRFAKEIHALTQGMTNVAMGSVTALWNDARQRATADPTSAALPDRSAIDEAMRHTDLTVLVLSEDGTAARLTDPHTKLDAGALGKGYVARVLRDALIEIGCSSFLLNLGGNTVAYGTKADGEPWVVGLDHPATDAAVDESVSLTDGAVVTSGSNQRYFMLDGIRYHHIIHPDTGYPTNHCLSVSVLCSDAALADALSTALFSMTVEEGLALVASLEQTEAVWFLANGERVTSVNFDCFPQGGAS